MSEIDVNPKIDADALKTHRRRFCGSRPTYHIDQAQCRQYADKFNCVYATYSVKDKIENETNITDRNSNLT
jgi:hypothetical protein